METELINQSANKDDVHIEHKIETFEDILEVVGGDGPFQKKFIWIFNFTYSMVLSLMYMNILLALAIPKHWCYVPGRENTNYTIEKWWELTLPTEVDNKGQIAFSKCQTFSSVNQNLTVACENGWEYEKTWYESTIVTDNDWVCDKEVYVTHSFIIGRLGEFGATLILGSLGDTIGRRPIVIITIVSMIINRILILFTSSNYTLFMTVSVLNSFTTNAGFLATMTIAMEITDIKLRETAISAQYIGWTIGVCVLSITMWIVRRWDYLIFLTTLPAFIVFVLFRYLIESPRLLISRGKIHKAYVQLKKIADINGKELPDNFLDKLYALNKKDKRTKYGIFSLASSCRLLKNTILLGICWSTILLCIQTLLYNFNNLQGNPFLIFLLLALVEIPVNIVGNISCKYFGRRFLQLTTLVCAAIASIGLILSHNYENPILTFGLVSVVKFFVYCAIYILDLQSLEVFPTCARQSGTSANMFFANAASCLSPYISYLGSKYDIRYPYFIMFGLVLIAALSGTFLPETSNATLPETIEDAKVFGKDQSYWNFLNRKTKYEATKTKH